MRLASMIAGAALLLAGCGVPDAAAPQGAANAASLAGDDALIASAQKISDAIGGCAKPADAQLDSKVIGLERGSIVMIGCSQDVYSSTHRLFAMTGEAPQLVTLPDYDASGWFASDQASLAEIDAGTGVLTTMRKSAGHGGCGSEGRYQWDGAHFVLQELRWQDCNTSTPPPFPIVWPLQQNAVVDPNVATPAP